jgi:hypothetical protein
MSEEGAATAAGAVTRDACATGSGVRQPNCLDEFAITSLAASLYDCQPNVAAIPRQNAIKKRKMARGARRLSESDSLNRRAFFRSCRADISSDGSAHRLGNNWGRVELSMELIDIPFMDVNVANRPCVTRARQEQSSRGAKVGK